MNQQPFVVIEMIGSSITAAHIRVTEEEAIELGVRIAGDCSTKDDPIDLVEVRRELTKDSIWDDGYEWVISITQAEANTDEPD